MEDHRNGSWTSRPSSRTAKDKAREAAKGRRVLIHAGRAQALPNGNYPAKEVRAAKPVPAKELSTWYREELNKLQAINGNIEFYLRHDHEPDEEDNKAEERSLDDSLRDPYLPSPMSAQIVTALDPFVALPYNLTDYQRSRVQIYMKPLAANIFGISAMPKYSTTESSGISNMMHSQTGVNMICVLVDETLCRMRGETQRSSALCRQRAEGYRALKDALRNRETRYQEVIIAMTIAGLLEWLFGSTHSQSMHVTAFDMLLRSKGTMKNALASTPGLEPCYIVAQFGFGRCTFSTWEKLEGCMNTWTSNLLGIFTSQRPLHEPWKSLTMAETSRRNEYRMREASLVKIIFDVLVTKQPPSMFAACMQTHLLYEFCWTLLQLGSRFDIAIQWFTRIAYLTNDSLQGGPSGDPAYELRGSVVATIVNRARRDVLANYVPLQVLDSDATITTLNINQSKMYWYLKPRGRELVFQKFYAWMSREKHDADQELISKAEIYDFREQIIETWEENRPRATLK